MRPDLRLQPKPTFLAITSLIVLYAWLALSPAKAEGTYRISVGDELQFRFLDDDSEPFVVRVRQDGFVQLPFLGSVRLGGQPLGAAEDMVAQLYTDREIYLEPALDISILGFRPVTVLGDVRRPGLLDFIPYMTVEQAVGMAGGPQVGLNDEETRALQRASVRSELVSTDGEIGRQTLRRARLRAQLAGADSIRPEDIGDSRLQSLDRAFLAVIEQQETEILRAERQNHQVNRALLERIIEHARQEIALVEEQIVSQAAQIASYDQEVRTSQQLLERGVIAAPTLGRLERQIADEEFRLLQLQGALSANRRGLTGLEREYASLDFQRQQSWRVELVQVEVQLAQLMVSRRALVERLALLDDWSVRAVELESHIEIEMLIRRRTPEGEQETLAATATDPLMPGDTLLVRLRVAAPPGPPDLHAMERAGG